MSRLVRWYYDVWELLPGVREGIFGRGVIALSQEGFHRVHDLPLLISDDLAMSSTFTGQERRVVTDAVVIVHPPRTWADLIRRRTRVAIGTTQAYRSGQSWSTDSRTGVADLVGLLRHRPTLAGKLPVFVLVTLRARQLARTMARQGREEIWLRDESSRRLEG